MSPRAALLSYFFFSILASMSRNLRLQKGAANLQEEMLTDSNLEELTQLVKSLAGKIDKLDSNRQSRDDVLCVKLQQLESITANLSCEINDLKKGLEFTNKEVEMVKATLSDKPDSACVATLERKPLEPVEKEQYCYMEYSRRCRERFLMSRYRQQHFESAYEVGRRPGNNACSSNKNKKTKYQGNTAPPLARPVHVYLLRYTDKQYILHRAAWALKDNPFLEANLTTCQRK